MQREFELEPADNARLAKLCGPLDENLRLVEDRLNVEVHRRGELFRVVGERASEAEDTLRELFRMSKDEDVTPHRVHLTLHERTNDADSPAGRDAEDAIRVQRGAIRARGGHQRDYLKQIKVSDLTFGVGPAGTGKTYLAVASAVEALQSERVRRIVLVRPAVEAGERLGFLPGDLRRRSIPIFDPCTTRCMKCWASTASPASSNAM